MLHVLHTVSWLCRAQVGRIFYAHTMWCGITSGPDRALLQLDGAWYSKKGDLIGQTWCYGSQWYAAQQYNPCWNMSMLLWPWIPSWIPINKALSNSRVRTGIPKGGLAINPIHQPPLDCNWHLHVAFTMTSPVFPAWRYLSKVKNDHAFCLQLCLAFS